jgi:hypothetical protein
LLGGDLSLINEIEQRHAKVKGSPIQVFLLREAENPCAENILPTCLVLNKVKYRELRNEAANARVRGVIYIITSSVVNLVKIGSWKGTISDLKSRYVTYYGQNIRLWAFAAEDCVSAEKESSRLSSIPHLK